MADGSFAKGNSSSSDLKNIESIVTAGGTATVTTPDTLTLKGATLSGDTVKITTGNLKLESLQDSSTFKSSQMNVGVNFNGSTNTGQKDDKGNTIKSGSNAGAVNFSQQKVSENFTSVVEQTAIKAGSGGFTVTVAGNTDLKGAVIASSADPAKNTLTTGTLTQSSLTNTEAFKASSIALGGGITGKGGSVDQKTNGDATAKNNPGNTNTPVPAVSIKGVGDISATLPVALGAKDSQSGVTNSAIAGGALNITSTDAASQTLATTISRDTATANAGALTQKYDEAGRADIQQGLDTAKALANQTSIFFANRAEEEKDKRAAAKPHEDAAIKAGVQKNDDGTLARDEKGNLIALTPQAQAYIDAARPDAEAAHRLQQTYGAGSAIKLVATALNGAAGGNVAGSLGDLAKATAVNIAQGVATSVARDIANDIVTGDKNKGADPANKAQLVTDTIVRGTLQAIVGCVGSTASGSGDCGSGALGAGGSVVINNALTGIAAGGRPGNILDQIARSNLVATVTTLLADSVGSNPQAASLAARLETENNYLTHNQIEELADELTACKKIKNAEEAAMCQAKAIAHYQGISTSQDIALLYYCGVGHGSSRSDCADRLPAAELYWNGKAFLKQNLAGRYNSWSGSWKEGAVNLDPKILGADIYRSYQFGLFDKPETFDPDEIVVRARQPNDFMKNIGAQQAYFNDEISLRYSILGHKIVSDLKETCGNYPFIPCNSTQERLKGQLLIAPGIMAGELYIEAGIGELVGPLASKFIVKPLINRAAPFVKRGFNRIFGKGAADQIDEVVIPDAVAANEARRSKLVANQQDDLKAAIDADGAAGKGNAFNELGRKAQDLSDDTLRQIEGVSVKADQTVGSGTGSVVDNTVIMGNTTAYVETKYSIGTTLDPRIVNQLTNSVNQAAAKGNGSFVVLMVTRAPTAKELALLRKGLGDEVYNKVVIVSSQSDLYRVVAAGLKAGQKK